MRNPILLVAAIILLTAAILVPSFATGQDETVGSSLDAVLADHEARISALEAAQATPTTEPEPTPTETPTVAPTATETPTVPPEPTATNTPEPTATTVPTGDMRLVPTFRSVGIYVADVGGNADVAMEWRVAGSETWNPGHPLMIDPQTGEARGSLVGLSPAIGYEIRVGSTVGLVTTRDEVYPLGAGAEIVVTDAAQLQAALNTALAGDTITVAPGEYVGPFTLSADGTADNYLTIKGLPGAVLTNNGAAGTLLTLTNADYIRITGLELRDARGNLIQFREGSDHALIERNAFIEPGYQLTTQPQDTAAALHFRQDSNFAVIRDNTFHRNTAMTTKIGVPAIFNWTAGQGAIVYGNTFTGGFEDAIRWAPEDTSSLNRSQDLDIYDNVIDGACFDDAIQPEGNGINVRIWGNQITHCFIGMAFAPLIEGPIYVFRNTITDLQHPHRGGSAAYKLGDEDEGRRGRKYFYHNTIIANSDPTFVTAYKQTNSGLGGITSRNNIIVVGRYIYEGGCDDWCDLDYDLLYTSDPSRFVEYRGPRSGSPESWCVNAGQACHSIEGLPEATDLEFGAPIPGFNDATSAWPSIGTPTVGVGEH